MTAFEAASELCGARPSPRDAVIVAIHAPSFDDPDKIYELLAGLQALRNFLELRVLVTDDDGLSVSEDRVDVMHHQFRNVRDTVEDEIAVGTNQAGDVHILVVDAQIVALAQKALDDLDHGTFAKIVGSRFEAEAQNADSL